MFVLVLPGAVPDVALSRYWSDYCAWFRGIVTTRTGLVYADELPMRQWPYRLFAQDWTYPALSVLVRGAPGQAIIVTRNDYRSNPPFDPSCGTVPALHGFLLALKIPLPSYGGGGAVIRQRRGKSDAAVLSDFRS